MADKLKLEIWSEAGTKPDPLRLRLFSAGSGAVGLHAVNAKGKPLTDGEILIINASGTLYRCRGVSENLGLGLDPDTGGRIMLDE